MNDKHARFPVIVEISRRKTTETRSKGKISEEYWTLLPRKLSPDCTDIRVVWERHPFLGNPSEAPSIHDLARVWSHAHLMLDEQ